MVELWKALIEHVLGWPIAVVLLGVIYKGPLSTLLRRIHKFGLKGPGVEISGEARQQLDAEIVGQKDPLASPLPVQRDLPLPDDLAKSRLAVETYGGDNPILNVQISSIKATLASLQFPLNASETTELLLRHLAATQLVHRAEMLYRLMFGSQVAALHLLNGGQQPTRVLRQLYARARKNSRRFYDDYDFQQWIDFLLQQQVVAFENDRYAITLLGQEFLTWVIEQGLPRKQH